MEKKKIIIPEDVHTSTQGEFIQNYEAITFRTGNLFLFAADQKIEHLNQDFHGNNIPPEVNNPEHIFKIASEGKIGALATHLGLITRYAQQYPTINYIAKLNGKTNLVPTQQDDPRSELLWTVEDVIRVKAQNKLPIRGVGFTVYLGSKYEADMLMQAAQAVHRAHQFGLVAILWMYPRGKAITNEIDPDLLAGAAGVAASLGADFVKINSPEKSENLKQAVAAAGNTKVVCAGGQLTDEKQFLQKLYEQISVGRTAGCATGRNIFQRPFEDAVTITKEISSIIFDGEKPK